MRLVQARIEVADLPLEGSTFGAKHSKRTQLAHEHSIRQRTRSHLVAGSVRCLQLFHRSASAEFEARERV